MASLSARRLRVLQRRLEKVPTYRQLLQQYQQTRTPVGAVPPSPNLAWWYLSHQAKQLLLSERLAGRFGGIPGQAPYWLVQEKGNVKSNVEGRFYITRAVEQWKAELGIMIKQWIGGYSFKEQVEREMI